MEGNSTYDSSWVKFRAMTPIRAFSREEKEFAKAFADALNHATAVSAAYPVVHFPAGSIAERLRSAYAGFHPAQRQARQHRAQVLLSAPTEERHKYFGANANLGAEAGTLAGAGLNDEMKKLLKQAVWARLSAQYEDIEQRLKVSFNADKTAGIGLAKTRVHVGSFTGDIINSWQKLTINQPETLQFRWETEVAEAEVGHWELLRVGLPGQKEMLVAVGDAGVAPGSIFNIDMGKYLPPHPPNKPAVYHVRVTPFTKGKIVPNLDPSAAAAGGTKKILGKAVGFPSTPVVITYAVIDAPPIVFDIYDVYKTLSFRLDSIEMIDDSAEWGTEEFHITGFVGQIFPTSSAMSAKHVMVGPDYMEVDPDGPRKKALDKSADFFLDSPNTPNWPQAFIGVLSILEEDDGGNLSDWQYAIGKVTADVVNGEVTHLVEDYLEEHFKDYVGDNVETLISQVGNVAQLVASLISSTVATVVGLVVAAIGFVVSVVVASNPDDYYGTEVFALVLPTNFVDYVSSLDGHYTDYGEFRLNDQKLDFVASSTWPTAAAYDGEVELTIHWVFLDKTTWSLGLN